MGLHRSFYAVNTEIDNFSEPLSSNEDFLESSLTVNRRNTTGPSILNNVASLPVATPIPSGPVLSPQNDNTNTYDNPNLIVRGTLFRRQSSTSIEDFDEPKQMLHVKIPSGMMPGQQVRINSPGGLITLTIPNRQLWKWNNTMNYNYFETEIRKQLPEYVLNRSGSWA